MTAAEQMHRFLRGVEKHSSPSVLDDLRVNIVIARYGTGLSHLKPPPFPPPSPSPIVPPQPDLRHLRRRTSRYHRISFCRFSAMETTL